MLVRPFLNFHVVRRAIEKDPFSPIRSAVGRTKVSLTHFWIWSMESDENFVEKSWFSNLIIICDFMWISSVLSALNTMKRGTCFWLPQRPVKGKGYNYTREYYTYATYTLVHRYPDAGATRARFLSAVLQGGCGWESFISSKPTTTTTSRRRNWSRLIGDRHETWSRGGVAEKCEGDVGPTKHNNRDET